MTCNVCLCRAGVYLHFDGDVGGGQHWVLDRGEHWVLDLVDKLYEPCIPAPSYLNP